MYITEHLKAEFYGKMFRDRELSSVYVYTEPVEIENPKLQKEEVEAVRWMDYEGVQAESSRRHDAELYLRR